jgi:hypothetical protein
MVLLLKYGRSSTVRKWGIVVVLIAQPVVGAVVDSRFESLRVYSPCKAAVRRERGWQQAIGERVRAEGLAWGAGEKGLGQRLLLDGQTVQVRGVDFSRLGVNGKPVRVLGTLRSAEVEGAGRFEQTFSSAFRYPCIEAEKLEAIARVQSPILEEAPLTSSKRE